MNQNSKDMVRRRMKDKKSTRYRTIEPTNTHKTHHKIYPVELSIATCHKKVRYTESIYDYDSYKKTLLK